MSREQFNKALLSLATQTSSKELKAACQTLKITDEAADFTKAVAALSEHLLTFSDTALIGRHLPLALLQLVSAKIPLSPLPGGRNDCHSDADKLQHLENCIALSLLSDHPDVLQYALKYFELNPLPPFEASPHHSDSYNVAPKKRRLQQCRPHISDREIVSCSLEFFRRLPNEFAARWNWGKFVENFSCHEDTEIKWMVKECMSILSNMTEIQSNKLSQNLGITPKACLHFIVKENTKACEDLFDIVENEYEADLDLNTDGVVNIDGIMLPVYDKKNVQKGNLVPVKSTLNNLRSVALAVASGKALCLMGPVGSGKTSLVEHLASATGRKGTAMRKVQLGDQTDSRMLLGTYQCTDVPGEFLWRPGVLTEAVQNGHWLLLEDIDCAALDVASVLSSLLERNVLSVPGYRDSLPVTPGFQLFVTQRTVATNYGFQKKMSSSSALLQKHLAQINVEPLSRSELAEIIQLQFPSLTTICNRMLEVFLMFSVGSHDASLQNTDRVESTNTKAHNLALMRGSRLISTRDLMKWCARAVVDFDVTSPESALKVLQDAIDIFTCSVPQPDSRLELAKKVGTCLGIVETKSEFYVNNYKPNVRLNPSCLEVGRAKVERKEKSSVDFDKKQVVFSFTRPSACLLERIACCVTSNEPVLLVGETGTGKTSSIQYLARQTGHKLVVINMNQQSDSADLLGGYKPVDLKYVISPIHNEFEALFRSYYNVEKNQKFLSHIDVCYRSENWKSLLTLMSHSHKAALTRIAKEPKQSGTLKNWQQFGLKLTKLEQQVKAASRLTFAFIEGSLVKAMQEGHWVLLDEINLASAEILECLSGLLEDRNESIDLLEKGDRVPIKRHRDFTLFACMNPATDVGKKELPVGLRNRFTEFFVDELQERNDLILLVGDYLYHMNLPSAILEAIYSFYVNIRKEAKLNLVDGSGHAPHYSLRTLCRALTAAAKAKCGTVARSLYESFCLSFLTQLDSSSHPKVEKMIAKAVIGNKELKSVLNQAIPEPQNPNQQYLYFEGHWIPKGKLDISIPEGYILTPTVRKNLRDIARIISLGKLPVLLQGDTSVGKTSLITYIAKASGNYCVRINNHEHTDLQEYIGSYATDSSGKLVFSEGVLVEAMRKGYWIILDELNLAPSDVLEALNRVLDDNRELYIPETQQVVKADPNFMLFATQNPPGLYGGRKMLSRAFRNRFVELHFDEIPRAELETILHKRCHMPPSYCKKMISVMAELQIRRRGSAAVQGKDGFITLRDLFRWGQRYKLASADNKEKGYYDWDQHIADEGYLVLAGKVRQPDERHIIQEVIKKHINKEVDPDNLFTLTEKTSAVTKNILEAILNNRLPEFSHVVWTYNMRRLAVLIAKSFAFTEPVLLVGETGCGKTTISQVLAALRNSALLSVNCHMHTESSDFLGGLRPVRQYKDDGKLFEWVDGPLIKAMEQGHIFLADEISLADDSVLERLNSLLEPERQLLLAERGTDQDGGIHIVSATDNFHFIGTMNPGGDYGKKELSPALRNRFTEIWCETVTSREDLLQVLERSVHQGISLGNQEDGSSGIGNRILDFTDWLKTSDITKKFPFSIRDLLSWVNFINSTVANSLLDTPEAYVHGACLTFLDCFGTALTGHIELEVLKLLRKTAMDLLLQQITGFRTDQTNRSLGVLLNNNASFTAESDGKTFGIRPFYIEMGPHESKLLNGSSNFDNEPQFTFTAPTTGSNTLRLLRGLQLNKAILLEGNPGVGKTSLVTALAKATGHKVVRINLSDQTDITDLFGTDLPSEDGSFTFKEGAFLTALRNGDWILLDELNLAPQPVLEGLNACLDHRAEIYIPELDKTFKVQEKCRLFACQNPLKQGGARRGLPVSFLNRFTQVYIDILTEEDLIFITSSQYPTIPKDILLKIVTFTTRVSGEISHAQLWGHKGSPWEMNLRDIQRWCDAIVKDQNCGAPLAPGKFVDILYVNRMRTQEDKQNMVETYSQVFDPESSYPLSQPTPQIKIDEERLFIGDVSIGRNPDNKFKNRRSLKSNLLVLRSQLPVLKSLVQCIKMNWLSILIGPTATGKSSVVQVLADLTGNELQVVPVTSAMDISDLLGGYEQVDYNRNLENLYESVETLTIQTVQNLWLSERNNVKKSVELLNFLHQYKQFHERHMPISSSQINEEMKAFEAKVSFLLQHCDTLMSPNKENSFTYSMLKEIKTKLNDLSEKVSKSTSINAGGKFEWVDSLLVKALIEGSWILMDNVNLTSSAVLDRLNGLLEPNGVLSIPERGEINEIRPHPNFRIFFTMDPKHGEISRAMRNRGVETFILRTDEQGSTLVEAGSRLDLVALLSSSGLPSKYHSLCIDCHELMSSFVQGLDRPSISHLLQAAYLTWQQMLRGIPLVSSVCNSFSDVYIKPRCGGDFTTTVNSSLAEMKNTMLSSLKSLILTRCAEDSTTNTNHTLKVAKLLKNSSVEIVKQNIYSILRQNSGIVRSQLYLLYTLLVSYQRCPSDSLELQYELIKEACGDNVTLIKLNNNAYNINKSTDLRFFPEIWELNRSCESDLNRSFAFLYHTLVKFYVNHTNNEPSTFSAFRYSNAVWTGRLTDDFAEYPILKNCQQVLELMDKLIEESLTSPNVSVNDHETCEIIKLLNWRTRFVKMCNLPIFTVTKKDTPILNEEVLMLLQIHFYWLQKYLHTKLAEISPKHKSILDPLNATNLSARNANSPFNKLSKKMRNVYGQPKLYRDREQYENMVAKRLSMEKITIDTEQSLNKQVAKIMKESAIQESISNGSDDASTQTNSTDIMANKKLEGKLFAARLLPIKSYIFLRWLHMNQNLLHCWAMLLVNKEECMREDLKVLNVVDVISLNNEEASKTLMNSSFELPIPFLEFLHLLKESENNYEMMKGHDSLPTIVVSFWNEFYKLESAAPACYAKRFFELCKSSTSSDGEEAAMDSLANSQRYSMNLPLLPFYVVNLALTEGAGGHDSRHVLAHESISLKDSELYSQQLTIILNIIWKNISTLDTSAELKIISDAAFESRKFEQLLSYTNSAVTSFKSSFSSEHANIIQSSFKDQVSLFFQESRKTIEDEMFVNLMVEAVKIYLKMEELYKAGIVNRDLKILSTKLSLLTSVLLVKFMAEISPVDPVEKDRLKLSYIEEDIKTLEGLLGAYYMQGLITGVVTEDGSKNVSRASDVTPEMYNETNPNRQNLIATHPYCKHLLDAKKDTIDRIKKYASGNTFRPAKPPYFSLVKECKHFLSSIFSSNVIEENYNNLTESCDKLSDILYKSSGCDAREVACAQSTVRKSTSWQHSVQAFYKKIEKEYSEEFPDIAKPLLSAISQTLFGLSRLICLLTELVAKVTQGDMTEMMEDLIMFPNAVPRYDDGNKYLSRFLAPSVVQLVNRNIISNEGSVVSAESEIFEILKMCLCEVGVACAGWAKPRRAALAAAAAALDALVAAWDKQQRAVERHRRDEDNLYVTKSKCEDIDEDEMAYEEIKQMFPSYSEQDFVEFKPPTLEENKALTKKLAQETTSKPVMIITPHDVTLLYKWHSEFIQHLTAAEWLSAPQKKLTCNYLEPLLQRYPTFSKVMQNAWQALDADFEGKVSPSLLVLLSQVKSRIDGSDSSGQKPDFYLSAWVSEVRQCIPVLQQVREATENLLSQWPDFPTLKDIVVIIDRITSFPATSPVARFLAGLELLRDKIEEWNKNAHRGNNLVEVSLEVGRQIISWRRLEMAHWRECLATVYRRKQSEAHKFWFFLYGVVKSYLNLEKGNSDTPEEGPTEATTPQQVTLVLRDFMEKSNLAEYEVRLDIVYTYHCHLVHLEQSNRRDELLSVLWNTYNYYGQFSAQVASHIKNKRAPIEKKLRDFVKICSWDRDLSYWSVKDTVEKAHKTLHKHMKEFEEVLKQSASCCLVLDSTSEASTEHVGIWDRPKRATSSQGTAGGSYLVDPLLYVALARNVKKYLDQCDTQDSKDSDLLSKIPSLFTKAKKLCRDCIAHTAYPSLVQSMDDFVTQVIETSTHLGSLEVDASAPKQKQTSQAKNILQQKRKALADLFRSLGRLGLSHRAGLVRLAAGGDLYDSTLPPVDLNAALSYLKSKRCDTMLSSMWSGCETYFQKNIARHRFLAAALQSPHQDLGLQNMERCKGFAAALLNLTYSQKKAISKYSRHLCDLRNLLSNIALITECHGEYTGKVSTLHQQLDLLTEAYSNINITLEQFVILLKSCPEESTEYLLEFDQAFSKSPIVRCFKNTEEWTKLYDKINDILNIVLKQRTALHKATSVLPKVITHGKSTTQIISQNLIEVTNDAYCQLEDLKEELDSVLAEYQYAFHSNEIINFTPRHPVLRSLVELSNYIDRVTCNMQALEESEDEVMEDITNSVNHVAAFTTQTEDLVATLLLVVQSIYKKHLMKESNESADVISAIDEIIEGKTEEKVEEQASQELLSENHLKEHLVEALTSDVKTLQLEIVISKTDKLLSTYLQDIENRRDKSGQLKDILMRVIPILEQATLFVQYFVTQQVATHRVSCKMLSVLLKIFSDLATKGFCKPADVDMEEGEGEGGPGRLAGGTGLGEGEGQKDVSDRIENQDQLDEARRPGEEEKEKDRDCKEEEKGVNMTDDFDSHLQDVDKKDGEESDQDGDDNEKQMGELDNAAERLDQQIWGSEEEGSGSDEEQPKDKEERGAGEKTGEREMAAREDKEEGKDDGGPDKERKSKKDLNEMQEPEVDDDHVDPYHGNQQPLPEPEAFDMPEQMNLDDEQNADDKEGETETENPFDIDVMKEQREENPPEETAEGQDTKDKDKGGQELSDDEDATERGEQEPQDKPDENGMEVDETPAEEDDATKLGEDEPEPALEEPGTEKDQENPPKLPDPVNPDEEKEVSSDDKREEPNPEANPSNNDPSLEDNIEKSEMEKGTDDQVQTNPQQNKDEESAPYEQAQEQSGEERQSTGRAELDDSESGHRGREERAARAARAPPPRASDPRPRRNRPAETRQERTLGKATEKVQKQSRTLNAESERDEEEAPEEQGEERAPAELYQHVEQAGKNDIQALDAATKEQAEQQPAPQREDDEETAPEPAPDEDVAMDVDQNVEVEKADKELAPEKSSEQKRREEGAAGGEEAGAEGGVEVEGERVPTSGALRPGDTTYHTRVEEQPTQPEPEMGVQQYLSLREWLTSGGGGGGGGRAGGEAAGVWRRLWHGTAAQARLLSERLRLVLEPTGRSRLAGDFRTGRRINMRRVIPYIASHFRKDRIWLRRTKPARREYKIALAVDDSSSMADNRSKELAFESLALVSQALNLLESGELCVLSFGEQPSVLHPFSEQFSEQSGANVLERLRFDQTKTRVAQLLDFATVLFEEQLVRSEAVNAKLLVVVSDGRGIFSEGEARVAAAVRRARQAGIFLVYVVIDNPDNKDSIMDIRKWTSFPNPVTGKPEGTLTPYLDSFPFPFYLIVRDMRALPAALGDALRQWFELAANSA